MRPANTQPAQPVLPLGVFTTFASLPGASIQEQFERFHRLNPWVYDSMVILTQDWIAHGHRRLGIGMINEVLRWQYGRGTTGDEFKLNNNFRSRYVRLLLEEHPEFDGVFETRILRAA